LKQSLIIILLIILPLNGALACSCSFAWNDSFSRTAKHSEFVALAKVISYDEYLDRDILGHDGKMPFTMTVEIIKKYKGKEQRKRIRIQGDDGIMCRPYLSEFKINGHYLIAPIPLEDNPNTEYEFFVCRTDYLEVDMDKNEAFGNYSFIRKRIDISTFENKLKYGDWDIEVLLAFTIITLLSLNTIRRNKKRNANNG
jgi:hypothetical protein